MSTLYIIGNGFDLYHRIDTYYSSFGLFLQRKYPEYYIELTRYLRLPALDERNKQSLKNLLWADFENSFTRLDAKELLNEFSDYAGSPSDKDYTDGDLWAYVGEIKKVVEFLTVQLRGYFKEFINSIEYPETLSPYHLNIDKQGVFLSFNYTDTLERYYNINRERILYIHGKAESNTNELILGHGVPPVNLLDKRFTPPDFLKPKEVQIWKQQHLGKYDQSYIQGMDTANSYFNRSFKDCHRIIEDNKAFFDSLFKIQTVYILGHSLSNVDIQYLIKVVSSVKVDSVHWKVSYFLPEQIDTRKNTLIVLGIREEFIDMIKIESLKSHIQLQCAFR